MNAILLSIAIVLFIMTFLFCRYELKKGQIKMRDNEIPVSEVTFKEVNTFYG